VIKLNKKDKIIIDLKKKVKRNILQDLDLMTKSELNILKNKTEQCISRENECREKLDKIISMLNKIFGKIFDSNRITDMSNIISNFINTYNQFSEKLGNSNIILKLDNLKSSIDTLEKENMFLKKELQSKYSKMNPILKSRIEKLKVKIKKLDYFEEYYMELSSDSSYLIDKIENLEKEIESLKQDFMNKLNKKDHIIGELKRKLK
jgi:hypothetical protein